jgi:uncharacterized membrane protein HdeD (DUF308 family)
MWHAPGFWWSLLSAVFTMGVGGFLFAQPELGMVTLFLVLITFLILEGIVTIMFALDHWRELSGRWGLMLASGIVDLTLASVILIGLPAAIAATKPPPEGAAGSVVMTSAGAFIAYPPNPDQPFRSAAL